MDRRCPPVVRAAAPNATPSPSHLTTQSPSRQPGDHQALVFYSPENIVRGIHIALFNSPRRLLVRAIVPVFLLSHLYLHLLKKIRPGFRWAVRPSLLAMHPPMLWKLPCLSPQRPSFFPREIMQRSLPSSVVQLGGLLAGGSLSTRCDPLPVPVSLDQASKKSVKCRDARKQTS